MIKKKRRMKENLFLENKFSLPLSTDRSFLRQNLSYKGTTRVKKGTEDSKGNSFQRAVFIYLPHTMAHTRESSETVRQKRIQVSKPFYFSMCRAPLFFQGEESVSPRDQACSMRVDPSPFTPPQPLDKATFSLCSLNHANPAYNAYLLLCSTIFDKNKREKKRERENIYISNRLRNALIRAVMLPASLECRINLLQGEYSISKIYYY